MKLIILCHPFSLDSADANRSDAIPPLAPDLEDIRTKPGINCLSLAKWTKGNRVSMKLLLRVQEAE